MGEFDKKVIDDTEPHDSQPDDSQPDDTEPHDTEPHDTEPDDSEPCDSELDGEGITTRFIGEFGDEEEPVSTEEERARAKTESQRFYEIQKRFKAKTLHGRTMLNRILKIIARGTLHAGQFNVKETLKIDDDWLLNIEGHINHIDNIVRNPKSALKEERIIVNTSKAKKTDSETIRYLSSHTSDIESIRGDEIRPSRLNVREIDSDLAIYENRFVYALMVRLRSFLEQRYNAIKEQINCFDINELKASSRMNTPSGDIEYDLRIKVRDKLTGSVSAKQNAQLLERIESARTHVSALMGSEFARTLSKSKLLMPPINKTNAIRGHTDYRGCYNLWLFLSSYTALGYSVNVEEQNLELAGEYYDDLTFIMAASIKNMLDNNMLNSAMFLVNQQRRRVRKFKPTKSFGYSVEKRNISRVEDEELINQLYYEKIKQLLRDSDGVKKQQDEQLRTSFRTYYKKITSLNNSLYNEALELEKYREQLANVSSLEDKKQALLHYEEGLKRLRLLRGLKESDFRAAEREEKRLLEKTAKLRVAIKEQREKQLKEELERRLERERKELEQKEARRQAKLLRERQIAQKKEQAMQKRLEYERLKQEQRDQAIKERLLRQRQQEQEREQARLKAAREKEKQKIKAQKQREKQRQQEKLKKQKEQEKLKKQKEQEKLKKQKEQEKLKKQKQLALQKDKNKLKKDCGKDS